MTLANVLLLIIVILMAYIPCIQCSRENNITCNRYCSISFPSISDITNVRLTTKEKNKHVIYLSLVDTNQTLLIQRNNTVFAWVRLEIGQSLMTIPYDFYALSSFLPIIFEDILNVTVDQYPDGCFRKLGNDVQDDCTNHALKYVADVKFDCTGTDCGTICKRDINTTTSLDNITFTCCRKVHDAEVCDEKFSTSIYLVTFRYISILLSVILAACWLKWFIRDIPSVQG